ncbi:charged multivesicular body protein 4 [Maniola hyperantus]|uniref:charged multivesicular body protein 4 n=1 Tax=Aphantopus hyperantus TaxID=2795564 RepID=UPI0015697F64|nr:charged multivesicular body protein 4c [Maniola hyperantus]
MSFLGKLFGGKKEEKGPTTHEAIQKLRETEELLVKKQEFLERKIEAEIQAARKHGTKNKRAAIAALKRKKRYEKQLNQIDGTLTQIEAQREALEGATTNAQVLNTMKDAANAMKLAHKDIDVDKVHDIMDDIAEQHDISREITDAISNNVAFPNDVDEDELERELEELEQEELDKEMIGISVPSDNLPDVPATEPVRAKAKPSKEKEDDDEDFKLLKSWAT